MCIFEAKEWWSVNISNNEEFDGNSICIDNIDNESPPKNKICVSSFKGILRIYEPSFGISRVENLLFEKFFDNPILQIASGNFIMNSTDKQLIILQSKRLLVINFANLRGAATIKTCYEHRLVRNGFNFCLGRIGERSYDVLFVQSIDGVISIFEGETCVNNVAINEIIFPGPMAFLSRKDIFLISNTAYELECYPYNNLATVKSKSEDRKIIHSWKINLGELMKDIKIVENKITKKQEIVVLTETLLTLIDENGKIIFQRKLDFEPMAIHCYNIDDPGYSANKLINMMYMISTNSDHVMIYKGLNLAWAMKIFDTSVYMNISEFGGSKGLIVSLSDNGRLSVLYLGMETVKNNRIQLPPARNMDLRALTDETEKLLHTIQKYESGVEVIPADTLQITVEVNPSVYFDEDYQDHNIFYTDHKGRLIRAQVNLIVSFHGVEAENIKISIITPHNILCDDSNFLVNRLNKLQPTITKVLNFKVFTNLFPTFSNVKVYATYFLKNKQGNTEKSAQSTGLEFDLPLSLFLRTTAITKDAPFKITLCTNKNPISIAKIFNDLTENFIDSNIINSNPNMIGFSYPNKTEVTVIVSKNAGRYRIQSTFYESLLFITHQIISRLSEIYQFEISFWIEDDLNILPFFNVIDNHFKISNAKKVNHQELERYTTLYTILQKNLLNKYKEKNPPNLNNLDFLLKSVYKSISKNSDNLISVINEIKYLSKDLIIWTESILYMMKLRCKLSDENYQILRDCFPLDNINDNENSWEEITMTNMINLHKLWFTGEKNNFQEVKQMNELDKWKIYFKYIYDKLISN